MGSSRRRSGTAAASVPVTAAKLDPSADADAEVMMGGDGAVDTSLSLQERNKYVRISGTLVQNTSSSLGGESFSPELLSSTLSTHVTASEPSGDSLEFEMASPYLDLSLANALRRIMIAEVPTVAIESVLVKDNTSVIQDEVLAHRLGLVPIKCDPAWLEWKSKDETASEKNTIVFTLDVTCYVNEEGEVVNEKVKSSHLKWLPGGSDMGRTGGVAPADGTPNDGTPNVDNEYTKFETSQRDVLAARGWDENTDGAPRPVHEDILLVKLRPKQRIRLEAHCVKGEGCDHAKFSPVATCWYRLYPSLRISESSPVTGKDADALVEQVEALCGTKDDQGNDKPCGYVKVENGVATVAGDVRDDFKAQELWRQLGSDGSGSPFEGKLSLQKDKHHFIFTVETAGQLTPQRIVKDAIHLLREKARKLVSSLDDQAMDTD